MFTTIKFLPSKESGQPYILCPPSKNMKSVLPSTIRLQNELPYNIRSLPTLSSFTHAIKNRYCSKPSKCFDYCVREENILQCQLCNSASQVLCTHFLNDNPSCYMCDNNYETCSHFFIECPIMTLFSFKNNILLYLKMDMNLLNQQ